MSKSNVLIVAKAKPKTIVYGNPDDWEYWGLNDMSTEESDITYTRWFELHRYEHLEEHWRWRLANRLGEWFYRKIPVYTFKPREFPKGPWDLHAFPYEAMAEAMPMGMYHCSSLDWMLAYAIFEGFTTIRVTGVNNWSSIEPQSSRACLEWWIGYGTGLGLDITVDNFDNFKMFHTVRSEMPYGLDPDWMPVVDHEANNAER